MLALSPSITGPDLDQLDEWGALDSLRWSLDSSIREGLEKLSVAGGDNAPSGDGAAMFARHFFGAVDAQSQEDEAGLDGLVPLPFVDDAARSRDEGTLVAGRGMAATDMQGDTDSGTAFPHRGLATDDRQGTRDRAQLFSLFSFGADDGQAAWETTALTLFASLSADDTQPARDAADCFLKGWGWTVAAGAGGKGGWTPLSAVDSNDGWVRI